MCCEGLTYMCCRWEGDNQLHSFTTMTRILLMVFRSEFCLCSHLINTLPLPASTLFHSPSQAAVQPRLLSAFVQLMQHQNSPTVDAFLGELLNYSIHCHYVYILDSTSTSFPLSQNYDSLTLSLPQAATTPIRAKFHRFCEQTEPLCWLLTCVFILLYVRIMSPFAFGDVTVLCHTCTLGNTLELKYIH